MTNTVGDFSGRLADAFNLGKAAGWDPVGLQFGDPAASVKRVAVCHEVTPAVVGALIDESIDLVVTYHPLLFRPTNRLVAGNGASGRAYRLIAAGVSLVAAHTAFDLAPGGTADSLAAELGLIDVAGFGPAWGTETSMVVTYVPAGAVDAVVAAMASAGAGRIGHYTHCSFRNEGVGTFRPGAEARPALGSMGTTNHEREMRVEMVAPHHRVDAVVAALVAAHPYEEPAYGVTETRANAGFIGRRGYLETEITVAAMADLVADRLGGVIRVAGSGSVRSVAVVPGSGGSLLSEVDADLVVTGDMSHHQARELNARGVNLIDPGHAATERPGVQALYAAVAEMIGSAVDMTDLDSDPWKER